MMLRRRNIGFSIMVAGPKGIGKSSFINTLFNREIVHIKKKANENLDLNLYILEIDCEGVRKKVTVVETPGFGTTLDDSGTQENILSYIRTQFNLFLAEETKVKRNRDFEDSRVHALLYFIKASPHGLRKTELAFLKKINGLVNIIPVIGKADGMAVDEMESVRSRILDKLKTCNIEIFDILKDELINQSFNWVNIISKFPFSVICDDKIDEEENTVRGRKYRWGNVETDNQEHCEFSLSKEILMSSHMDALIETTVNDLYERYRTKVLSEILPKADLSNKSE